MRRGLLLSCVNLFFITAVISQTPIKSENSFSHYTSGGTRATGAFNYILTTFSEEYYNLTGATSINNGEIWDEADYIVPVSFPFELNGHPITQLEFYGSGAKLRSPTADPDISALLFPFETDLIDRGANGSASMSPLSYKVEGPPGERIQKIEWKNAGSYYEMLYQGSLVMYINFQLWLYEGSNTIEFRFGDSFINDPVLFYDGNLFVGLADLNEAEDYFVNPHFFAGSPYMPYLSLFEQLLEGTPENETVYKLSLNLPIVLEVNGINNTSECEPNGTAAVTATGGASPYSFAWSTNGTTDTITHLEGGIYTVTVTDAAGTIATGSILLTGPDSLAANAGSTPETQNHAEDGTAFSIPTGGISPYTYLWNTGSTASMISGLAPGIYTVFVTDHEDCITVDTVEILAFECPGLSIEAIPLHSTCFLACNGSIDIINILNGIEPYSYLWSNGSTASLITDLCTDFYSTTVTDAAGCTASDVFLISEPNDLFANTGTTPETVSGSSNGTAWAAPTGGVPPYQYLWSTGSTDSLIVDLGPSEYAVTVTDANDCTDVQSCFVEFLPCGEVMESSFSNPSCFGYCDGSAVVTVIGGIGSFRYLWNTGDTTNSISEVCAGLYVLTITDIAENCSVVNSFALTPPDSLVIITDEVVQVTDTTLGSISVSIFGGTPPYLFTWSSTDGFFSFSEDIINLDPGFYSLTVSDFIGCSTHMDSIQIIREIVGTYVPDPLAFKVYPNPGRDIVYVQISGNEHYQIQLQSADGRIFHTGTDETVLDVSPFSPGMYFLKIISGEKYSIQPLSIIR